MNSDSVASESDSNLSGLGRALLGTNEGSKPSAAWVPPTAEELHQILPQYEIVRMLGRGGMGAVYMGRQTSLDRPVAIKILSAALEDSDAGFAERFKNEARAMAKLNHPGIVSVYDFGEAPGGLLYIVMEYVDGTDVAKMIAAKSRLHTEHAMAVTAHVCDALAYAHERGIIHRDIKPANIMVGYDGAVKVADFGLAKVNAGGNTLGLTQSGMAMGTLHYMAPEALMLGAAVDHRADIYAVGVMLYQTLTGKLPQGMFKMPSLLVPGLDPRYDGIIAKAIMEDREARYQSAREMRTDLDSILTQPVVKVEAPPAKAAAAGAPQAAVLPTAARPQRPGARQPQPSAHAQPSYPPPTRNLAWLWVLLVLAALGGVVWRMLDRAAKPVLASTPTTPSPAPVSPDTAPKAATPSVPPTPAPSAAATAPQAATDDNVGWLPLFNGRDLNDWVVYPSDLPVDVVDGVLRIRGSKTVPTSGNLYYRGKGTAFPSWTDFEVICTVKTENKGNSGIFLHASPGVSAPHRANGVEVQVLNDPAFAGTPGGQSGGLQRLVQAKVTYRDGEWIQIKARVEGRRVRTWTKREKETQWLPVVDWTQPDGWAPPADRPGMKLGSGTISMQNNPPIDGAVWVKEVKFRSLVEPAPTPPVAASTGSVAVETFGSHRYQFVAGSTSWEEARTKAQGMGGHLAVITSKEENDWLLKTYGGLLTTTNRNIWLGAIEDKPNAGWKWITGEAFTPLGWGSGEPNGTRGGGGQVGHPFMLNLYSFRDSVVGWNDSTTHSSQTRDNIGFIVEWDTAPAAAPPALPSAVASATTWIDNRSRVLQAGFVSLSGDNLVLEAAGTRYPLALTALSPASQQIARQLAATRIVSAAALPGLWTQVLPPVSGKPSETQIFASQRAMFTGGGKQVQGSWRLEGGLLKMSWENGSRYELSSSGSADILEGTRFDPRGDSTPLRLVRNPAAPQVKAQIPADALTFGTSRYAYYSGTLTWKDAKARAEALGGHLATITTAAEDAWVIANFQSKVMPGRKQFWLGASQETPDQPWQWVTGETWGYTQWAPSEPNNAKGTDAKSKPPYMLGYLYQGGRMGWNDFSESQLNWRDVIVGYLVEWDNAPPSRASTAAPPVEDGFIDLFSPSERLAWRQCGKGGISFDNGVATTWVSGKGLGVPWYSKRMFANFVFKVEFRAPQPLFNSGMRLRFPNPGSDTKVVSMEGYEVNIADNGASPANADTFPTGGIAHLQAPSASPHRPLGEWNELEVTATSQSYTVVLNGQVVNRFTGNRRTEGYVGLENHARGPVQFRNVRIKPLL